MKPLILAAAMACAFAAAAPPRAAAETTKSAETKSEYVKRVRAELDKLSRKIDALESKAKAVGVTAHAGLDQKLSDLKTQRKTLKMSFAKLKRASGKAWFDLKGGVDKGIYDLKEALDEAVKD